MSDRYDYGPLRTYEVTWRSGHIETVQGHQVTFESSGIDLFGTRHRTSPPRFMIHGEFDGRWRLVIAAPEADLLSIRDVTDSEVPS